MGWDCWGWMVGALKGGVFDGLDRGSGGLLVGRGRVVRATSGLGYWAISGKLVF